MSRLIPQTQGGLDPQIWFKDLKQRYEGHRAQIKKLEASISILRRNILERRGARKTVKMDRYRLAGITALKTTLYKACDFQRRLLSLYEPPGPETQTPA